MILHEFHCIMPNVSVLRTAHFVRRTEQRIVGPKFIYFQSSEQKYSLRFTALANCTYKDAGVTGATTPPVELSPLELLALSVNTT